MIVGRNNAGKSTIIEALRLLSIVVSRYRFLTFYPVPNWLEIPVRNCGITPSLDSIEFDFDNVCHRYGDPPATIIGSFSSGERVEIYLNPSKRAIFAVIRKKNGDPLISKSQAAALPLPGVSILPQIGPLARSERNSCPRLCATAYRLQLGLDTFSKSAQPYFGSFRRVRRHGRGFLAWFSRARIQWKGRRTGRRLDLDGPRRKLCGGGRLDGSRTPDLATDNLVSSEIESV